MAFTLEGSAPAMRQESQLFSVPVSYTERWRTEHERIHPTTSITEGATSGDITFFIPPSSSGLISLNDICLELELGLQVKTKDVEWKMIGATDGVSLINNPLHSIFSTVHVTVANKLISDASTFYPYRAYIESLLHHSYTAQMSQLTAAGFLLDSFGQMNHDTLNVGETHRRLLFSRGHTVQLAGRIFSDLFDQEKPLITGVLINIRLVLAKPEFYLRVSDVDKGKTFRIIIQNPRISVRRHIPSPDYMIKVTEELQTRPCKYHVERNVVRVTDITKGTQSTVVTNLCIGTLPKVSIDYHSLSRFLTSKISLFIVGFDWLR